jgi:hypothetical protein
VFNKGKSEKNNLLKGQFHEQVKKENNTPTGVLQRAGQWKGAGLIHSKYHSYRRPLLLKKKIITCYQKTLSYKLITQNFISYQLSIDNILRTLQYVISRSYCVIG